MSMNLSSFKDSVFQNRKNILYYVLLSGLMLFLLRPGIHVPFAARILMMFLALFPAFSRPEYLPFCMTCIVGISSNAFYPILPTDPAIYLIIILILYINYKKRSGFFLNAFGIYFVFLLFSLAHGDLPTFLLWGLIAVFVADFIKEKSDISNLMMAFIIASFILSLLFLVYYDQFTVAYKGMEKEMERAYWTNANKFGSVIAAGGVMAVAYLSGMQLTAKSKFLDILSIITIALVIPAVSLNASRGAFLAFAIPSLFLIYLSRINTFTKVAILVIGAFCSYKLYMSTDLFDLLMARMQDDTIETGGHRTEIWKAKLLLFSEYDIASQIVGIGRRDCVLLAGRMSTHNDFLTAFIGYGYIGLTMFSLLIVFPIIKASKRIKKYILCLSIYMIIECLVLEPIFRGYLSFLMFYIFTIKYALIEKKEYEKETAIHISNLRNRGDDCKHD